MSKKASKSNLKKRGPGRPATGTDPTVTIRLPIEILRTLDKLRAEEETRTDLIRIAVEREIKRRSENR